MAQAAIVGTGIYAPENVVPNSVYNKKYGMDVDSFLRENRNIYQRHLMSEDQATSDLILPAAEKAMAAAGIKAEDLDLIVVSTDTPDYVSPSTASVVQYRLQAKNAGCFDLNTACAGFVTALDVGAKYIQADSRYRHILVVGAYGMSKYLDWDDFKIATLFADGAGAVVLKAVDDQPGVMSTVLYSDGQFHDYMGIYAGGTRTPISEKAIAEKAHKLQFTKKIPLETNPTHWPRMAHTLLDRIQRPLSDVKHFFFTQINIGSIRQTMDTLGVKHELAHNIMDRFGYTGSACIPMALADAAEQHKLKRGDLVLLLSSGGGMTMAASALEWAYDT
ncbi:MAG: ketoacyl-ACP synthase III [Bdellovibrionales bacterium]|nr:ketoacyl-ACP synthase III [Bdellovibrionales bacterium]